MKKMVIAGMLTVAVSLFADVNMNDGKTVDMLGLEGIKSKLKTLDKSAAGRWYLYQAQYAKYKIVREDEFELDGAIEQAYTDLVTRVQSAETFIGKKSELRLGSEFSKYDFKKEQFPISLMSKNSYVSFGGDSLVTSYSREGISLSFDNVNEAYAVLPMKKVDAKVFMKSRKDSRGNVNRDLTAKYSYIIKSIHTPTDNSIEKCQVNFNNCDDLHEIKMVGHITKLEILDENGKVLHTYSNYK